MRRTHPEPDPSPRPATPPAPALTLTLAGEGPSASHNPDQVRRKYPHDENLIELFQRLFMLLPIASVVGSWAFVIHG